MQIIFNPHDTLDISEFGIDIPISFNNAAKTVKLLLADAGSGPSPKWFHDSLDSVPTVESLKAVHNPEYIDRLVNGGKDLERELMRTFELVNEDGSYNRYEPAQAVKPLNQLFDILLSRGGGTIKACRLALETGEAWYFGGGFHHAHYDFGSGFCTYSDLLVARHNLGIAPPRTWIIDIDAHKGDGTADLVHQMHQRGDHSVIAMSVHMAQGWPLDEQRVPPGYSSDPAWIPSDVDVPVESGEEAEYTSAMLAAMTHMQELSKKYWNDEKPELVIVVAGSDPYVEDELPSTDLMNMTREQMLERNLVLRDWLRKEGLPAAWVQAGNYGNHSWKTYYDFLSHVLKEG